MTARLADLSKVLKLHNDEQKPILNLVQAVVDEPPTIEQQIDGGSTLEINVTDPKRVLLRDGNIRRRHWATVNGVRFDFTGIRKYGNRLTLVFEDSIVAALRRETHPLSIPAGSMTRAEAIVKIARDADVRYVVDQSKDKKLSEPVERSQAGDGEKTNAWDVIGALAEDRQWRRFSNGERLVVGPDAWLIERDKNPTRIREYSGPVHEIDFDLDTLRRASAARFSVDVEGWALPPGGVVRVHDEMGPAAGLWLVESFRWPLTSSRATVTLVRKRHELDEPKPVGPGDPGNANNSPRDPGDPTGTAGNPQRGSMVGFALAQSGKPYVYGASGPDAWDCSGLIQGATAHAGKVLPKPAANQWARCVQDGATISVGQALGIRGALLFRIGVSDSNHVAISLGNGSTVEAMGTPYGCGVFGGAGSRGWTGAALWV